MFAPFLVGFTLCISDGDADLPQHLLVNLADRCSQRPDGGRGVEIKDRHKIFVVEVAFQEYYYLKDEKLYRSEREMRHDALGTKVKYQE